jgi:hypothetical protein
MFRRIPSCLALGLVFPTQDNLGRTMRGELRRLKGPDSDPF